MRLLRFLPRPRRLRAASRRTEGRGSLAAGWKSIKQSLPDFRLVVLKAPQPPFFTTLHELLDRYPGITLGRLLDEAGSQVWGLTVLLLAILTFIPGVANVVSIATVLVGIGMVRRSAHPWLPERIRRIELHRGRIKEVLAKVESRLTWLAKGGRERRAASERFLGLLVAWSGLIALIPLPLPFANTFPALALILFGVALLEEWPLLGWYGAAISLGTTVYFFFSIRQSMIFFKGIHYWFLDWMRSGVLL